MVLAALGRVASFGARFLTGTTARGIARGAGRLIGRVLGSPAARRAARITTITGAAALAGGARTPARDIASLAISPTGFLLGKATRGIREFSEFARRRPREAAAIGAGAAGLLGGALFLRSRRRRRREREQEQPQPPPPSQFIIPSGGVPSGGVPLPSEPSGNGLVTAQAPMTPLTSTQPPIIAGEVPPEAKGLNIRTYNRIEIKNIARGGKSSATSRIGRTYHIHRRTRSR